MKGLIKAICLAVIIGLFISCSGGRNKKVLIIYQTESENQQEASDTEGTPGEYGELNFSFSSDIINLSDYDAMTNDIHNKISIKIEPSLKGEWQLVSGNQVSYVFIEKLKPSTHYTVWIDEKRLKALDGSPVTTKINGEVIHNGKYEFMTERIRVNNCLANSKGTNLFIMLEFNCPVKLENLTNKMNITESFGDTELKYKVEYAVFTNTKESNDVLLQIISTNKSIFIIKPEGLTKGNSYTLTVEEGLLPLGGNMGLKRDFSYDFETYKPIYFEKLRSSSSYYWSSSKVQFYPDDTLIFEFNNELDTRVDLKDKIVVNPSVENLSYYYGENVIYISGNFYGGQSYKITLKPGIKDIYGQTLEKEIVEEVDFEHGVSLFSMPYGYMVMENYLPLILPFKIRNVGRFNFKYFFTSDIKEIAKILTFESKEKMAFLEQNKKDKEIELKWKWDKLYNYRLDLAKMIKDKSGLMLYNAEAIAENPVDSGHYYIERGGIILFTDMGITVKSGPDNTFVFLRKLIDNTPVEGAFIYEVTKEGELILRGKTDAKGILSFPGGYPMPMIIAKKDSNITFNYGERNYYYGYYYDEGYEGDYEGGYYQPKNNANIVHYGSSYYLKERKLLLFTDRFLYKPGENVEVKGIVRFRANDEWSTVSQDKEGNKFKIIIKNSRGEEMTNLNVMCDDWGSFHFSVKIPKNAPTGYYQIQTEKYRSITFSVQDFKPARAEIKIIPSKDIYKWGDVLKADIIGWYLFGAPVMNPIKFSVGVTPYTYFSKRFPYYSFWGLWWEDDVRRDTPFSLVSGIGFPDKSGKIHIEKVIAKKDFKGDAQIMISGETKLDDESPVYGTKTGISLFNPVHVGIKVSDYFVRAGDSFKVGLVAVDENENVTNDQKVTLQIEKREWHSYQKVGVNGRLEWEWEQVKTNVYERLLTIGKKEITLSVKDPGYYVARAKIYVRGHEAVSETSFYAFGKGNVGWKIDDNYEIDIECDKPEYRVGDVARILVKNPFEKATALVTIEREKTYFVDQIEIKDSLAIIPVKITKDFIPNAYVSVMLFTGRSGTNNVVDDKDLARPNYRIGYVNLRVVPAEKKLNVIIRTDKEKYEPGQMAKVTIEARDFKNRAVNEAELTVAVVDRGILNLVNYEFPDPVETFYGPRALAVFTSEMREYIFGQRYLSEKGEIVGGDGRSFLAGLGLGMTPRLDFKSIAYYNDKLILSNGKSTEFTFKIPDNLTSWKIMAIAQTKSSLFGYNSKDISVSKPLMLLSTLPRFLRIGDVVKSGAIIYNYTGSDQHITVGIDAGGSIKFLTPKSTNIFIPENGSKEVTFDFMVPLFQKPEEIKFTIMAKAKNFQDAFQETIPVKLNQTYETAALYEKTKTGKTEKIDITENVVPEMGELEITLSPSAFTELKGSVDYLINYPYGCLEQKLSSILPLILGEDVIIKLGLLNFKTRSDLRALVSSVLSEIPKYIGNYGFLYWPNSYFEPNSYLTVYATFVMTMAKKKGYSIPSELFYKAIEWVKKYAQGMGEADRYSFENYKLLVRSFALYVLALNGIQYTEDLNELYLLLNKELNKNLSAKAYILKTASLYKEFPQKKEIIQTIYNNLLSLEKVSSAVSYFSDNDHWEWFYYNNTITTATILQSIIEANLDYQNVHKVINWLIQRRKGESWSSTHENAMVFWAFNSYLERFEKEAPKFSALVKINNEEIIRTMFSSRKDRSVTTTFPLGKYEKGSVGVDFKKEGEGILYYFLRYRYILKKYPAFRNAGFSLEKRIYDYETGKPVMNNKFIRGKRYIVRINVRSPKERNFVILDDPLPAGFEPVNLDFATEKKDKKKGRYYEEEEEQNIYENEEEEDYWYWWGKFDHREQYRDRVIFSAFNLHSGEHTVQYVVRAVTTGKFKVPQVHIEEMYNPETYGYVYQPDIEVIEEKK